MDFTGHIDYTDGTVFMTKDIYHKLEINRINIPYFPIEQTLGIPAKVFIDPHHGTPDV